MQNKHYIKTTICFFCLFLIGCGLKYTPSEPILSSKQKEINRKKNVEEYIWKAYQQEHASYIPIVFAPTTIDKPHEYVILDSLYQIKYENEQMRQFDRELEQKIANQKNVIANTAQKIHYIEHHIYGIQYNTTIDLYYADIVFSNTNDLESFTITQNYEIDTSFLPAFRSYITHESIRYAGYQPTEEERDFYVFYSAEQQNRPIYEQNIFLNHILHLMTIARTIQSIETEKLLQNLLVHQLKQRPYNSKEDHIDLIESNWVDDQLIYYTLIYTDGSQKWKAIYSPYLELIELTPLNR